MAVVRDGTTYTGRAGKQNVHGTRPKASRQSSPAVRLPVVPFFTRPQWVPLVWSVVVAVVDRDRCTYSAITVREERC
jgi:hypothetical protein